MIMREQVVEFRQLRYLTALCEEGSVTRAAQRLHVVQPAVSQQISKLEEELGRKLFQRTPKGMTPTEAGKDAYRLFVPIIRSLESARHELASRGDEISGHVSIGVIASVANNALSETLSDFAAQYPSVTIHATSGYTPELLTMVRSGQLDMAIVNKSRQEKLIDYTNILDEDFALICAADHPTAFPNSVALQDLSGYDLVIPTRRHGLRLIIDEAAESAGVRLDPRMEVDEIKTIEVLVEKSQFVTILPRIAVRGALLEKKLRSHAIGPGIRRRIVCAHKTNQPTSRAMELFLRDLRKNMLADSVDISTLINPIEE